MMLFWGSTGPASGTSRENPTSTTDGWCWFCPKHRWAQGFPKFSLSQNSAPIFPEEPILWYLPHFPITACAFTFRTGYGLSRAEIKAYSSFKLSRGLTSCLMNNWRGIESVSRLVIQLFATPWIIAPQAPLSMGFSRQKYWSGLPFPSPGDLPDSGIEPQSPTLQADSLPSEPPGSPHYLWGKSKFALKEKSS